MRGMETGVVSFLREVMDKKDTRKIKKIQACIKNRQGSTKIDRQIYTS